jgi:hypothetical protein
MQGRFSSGLSNLGRDISGRVQNRTQEEVDDFIGEVNDMAQERFEVNLSEPSQRQRDMQSFLSGKGQPRMAMKDGGAIKAQSGMFADISGAIASADAPTFSMPPAFASIYNFIKTNFPNLSDAEVRRQAQDVVEAQQNNEVPRIDAVLRPGLFKEYDMAKEQAELATSEKALREGLSSDANIPDISFSTQQAKKLNALKSSGDIKALKDEQLKRIAEASASQQALSNFTGGSEMSDLVDRLGEVSTDKQPSSDPKITTNNQMLINALKTKDDIRDLKNKELQRIASLASGNNQSVVSQAGISSAYDPTIYGESEELLEAQRSYTPLEGSVDPNAPNTYYGYRPKTRAGKYLLQYPLGVVESLGKNVMGGLEKGAGATRDFFTQPIVDGKPYDPSVDLAKYVGLPDSMVDEFNKKLREERDIKERESKPDITELKEGVTIDAPSKTEDKDDEGDKGGKGGAGGAGGVGALGGLGGASGALSDLSAQIAELKEKREKGRESEKWFALAEVGLGMLASQSPTLAGALGEGGLRGLKSFREGKKEYDKDMLGYLTTKASIQKTRGELGLKSQLYKKQIEALKNKSASGTYGIKEAKDDLNNTNQRIAKLLELSTDPQRQIGSDSESKAEIDRQLKNLLAEKAAAEVYLRSIGANVPFSFTGNQTTVPNLADK